MSPSVTQKLYFEELAVRMRALEGVAFQEFADRFGPRLRRYFCGKGLTISDAEDLAATCVGDIAIKIHKYRPTPEGSFSAWAFTLARHLLADWLKDHPGTVSLDDERFLQEEGAVIGFDQDLEEDPLKSAAISAVQEALEQLSETDRDIICKRLLEESQPYEEIAQIQGITANNARQRYRRAMERLDKKLRLDARIHDFLHRK